MAKKGRGETISDCPWEPTEEDVQRVIEGVGNFELKRINGHLASRFEQYCVKLGVLKIGDMGELLVRNPMELNKLNDIYEVIENRNYVRHKQLMEAFPEEEKKFICMIKEIGGKRFAFKRMPTDDLPDNGE